MPARAGFPRAVSLCSCSQPERVGEGGRHHPAAAPAAPAAATHAAPARPSPAAIAAADKILNTIGLKQSIAIVVPGMMLELETNVTRTRPEIRDLLRATLKAIQPEFDETAKQTYSQAEGLLASQMSEQDITQVAAFFDSPAGKKYVEVTPVFFRTLATSPAPGAKAVDRHPRARPSRDEEEGRSISSQARFPPRSKRNRFFREKRATSKKPQAFGDSS